MSDSIWHDRYVELPEDVFTNSVRPCVIAVDENKKFIGANYGLRGSIPEIKYWAIVDDLIAQADKAKRLQKAVDYALDTLKKAETTRELTVKGHYVHAISLDELHSVLKEIKQLIKE